MSSDSRKLRLCEENRDSDGASTSIRGSGLWPPIETSVSVMEIRCWRL